MSPTLAGRFFTTNATWEIPHLFIYLFVCLFLFLAVLGLHCCGLALVMVSGDYSLLVVHRFLFVVASLISEHRF